MIRVALFAALFVLATPAMAAPMWIERQAAPKSELIDPVFAMRDEASAAAVDHAAWTAFLGRYVVAGDDGINRVRYGAVNAEDRVALDGYISALEAIDVGVLRPSEQLAYWINLYNAATVRLILARPGVASIRDLEKPWDTPVATVKARALTLNDIEHGIIRPVFDDARIHYAVNCASIGCPNLTAEAFVGARLDVQLNAAARDFVNHPRGVSIDGDRVILSKIFGWYQQDFGADDAAVLEHIRRFAEPGLAAALGGAARIRSYRYDWSLNDAP